MSDRCVIWCMTTVCCCCRVYVRRRFFYTYNPLFAAPPSGLDGSVLLDSIAGRPAYEGTQTLRKDSEAEGVLDDAHRAPTHVLRPNPASHQLASLTMGRCFCCAPSLLPACLIDAMRTQLKLIACDSHLHDDFLFTCRSTVLSCLGNEVSQLQAVAQHIAVHLLRRAVLSTRLRPVQ